MGSKSGKIQLRMENINVDLKKRYLPMEIFFCISLLSASEITELIQKMCHTKLLCRSSWSVIELQTFAVYNKVSA